MRRFSEKIRYGRLGDSNENDALPRSSLSPAAGGDTERPRKFLKNKNEKKKKKKEKEKYNPMSCFFSLLLFILLLLFLKYIIYLKIRILWSQVKTQRV